MVFLEASRALWLAVSAEDLEGVAARRGRVSCALSVCRGATKSLQLVRRDGWRAMRGPRRTRDLLRAYTRAGRHVAQTAGHGAQRDDAQGRMQRPKKRATCAARGSRSLCRRPRPDHDLWTAFLPDADGNPRGLMSEGRHGTNSA